MRFNKFDLNRLVTLNALLAERSVSRVAVRLNLSPSATSDALVQVRRRMEPTPRAEGLQHVVRDMLVTLDSTITIQPSFDPTRSDRVLHIFVSNYTQMVLAPHVLVLAYAERCRGAVRLPVAGGRAAAQPGAWRGRPVDHPAHPDIARPPERPAVRQDLCLRGVARQAAGGRPADA